MNSPTFIQPKGSRSRNQPGKARSRRLPGQMTNEEIAYATHLERRLASGEIIAWEYEAIKLKLADKTTYTADFFIQLPDGTMEIHEVKGRTKRKPTPKKPEGSYTFWAEDKATIKIKVAAKQWPQFFFCICYQLPLKQGGAWQFVKIGE